LKKENKEVDRLKEENKIGSDIIKKQKQEHLTIGKTHNKKIHD
jgi:hypothetical protein